MTAPESDEYSPMMGNYINLVINHSNIIALLESQNMVVFDLFNALNEEQANYAYSAGKWTLKQVIGHLIDAERTFAYRAYAFSRGQAELPGFDENTYVELGDFNGRTIQDLAAEFKTLRQSNLFFIRVLSDEQLVIVALSNNTLTSVRALVYVMAGHVEHHLNIVRERYFGAVKGF